MDGGDTHRGQEHNDKPHYTQHQRQQGWPLHLQRFVSALVLFGENGFPAVFLFLLDVNAGEVEGRDANPDLGLDPGPVVPPHCPFGRR